MTADATAVATDPRALVQGLHRAVQQFEQALANL
jgi:hypothetical protein